MTLVNKEDFFSFSKEEFFLLLNEKGVVFSFRAFLKLSEIAEKNPKAFGLLFYLFSKMDRDKCAVFCSCDQWAEKAGLWFQCSETNILRWARFLEKEGIIAKVKHKDSLWAYWYVFNRLYFSFLDKSHYQYLQYSSIGENGQDALAHKDYDEVNQKRLQDLQNIRDDLGEEEAEELLPNIPFFDNHNEAQVLSFQKKVEKGLKKYYERTKNSNK